MDTDYFFLCPHCGNLTIATGSGDMTDMVTCHDCEKKFKAYFIAGVGNGINIVGKGCPNKIGRIYAVDNTWCSSLHKDDN